MKIEEERHSCGKWLKHYRIYICFKILHYNLHYEGNGIFLVKKKVKVI